MVPNTNGHHTASPSSKAKTAEAGKPIDESLSIERTKWEQVLLYLTAARDIIPCGTAFACFIGVQEREFAGFLCHNVFPVTERYTAINMQSFFPTQR